MRHMYSPLVKRRVRKEVALFLVFFVSAVAHEYIVRNSFVKQFLIQFIAIRSALP